MALSDDEELDDVPKSVSNYHFVDDKDEPISFSESPIPWTEGKNVEDEKKIQKIFLKGIVDNGLRTIYKQVIGWRFDLSNAAPQISVLTKDKCWMELEKPRKSYEIVIRTIMITVHCLHFARKNPEASAKSVWDYLSKTFSFYEARPSLNDLVCHMDLIGEAVQRDNSLANCKFLLNFLEEKERNAMLSDENFQATTVSEFIVDDTEDDVMEDVEEDESNDEDELFDSVCAFCDNGGELLCCEGSCVRSFHATLEAADATCQSLGFTNREFKAIQTFFCMNCKFKQHQCFGCGKLGSSDKFSGAEVFRCANATCGRFYHPHCVAMLLHGKDNVAVEDLKKRIVSGESFACPIHKCSICKQVEEKKNTDLQFAVCRRCPTSYHRKCLPKEIVIEADANGDIIARAWEKLLPNRILIYCLKHDIVEELGTPIRDHIVFPDVGEKKTAVKVEKRNLMSEFLANEENLSKKRRLTSKESFSGKSVRKASREMPFSKSINIRNESEKVSSESDSLRKVRTNSPCRKPSRENSKSGFTEAERSPTANVNNTSLGGRLYEFMISSKSGKAKLQKQDAAGSEHDKPLDARSITKKLTTELPLLDAATERRLLDLVKEAESSITLDNVIKRHEVPSTHAYSSKNFVDKNITLGKVEGTVEAVRTALKKLEENCSIEDAKAVCEPDALSKVFKWKNKLKVYLAPFLYGKRYTSFGRHFTKVEKLVEIADILHWYVESSDMVDLVSPFPDFVMTLGDVLFRSLEQKIVDFCCGANDFSYTMKKKLEDMGKKCSYKNYDFIQPKNDFNFEKRDWMTVSPDELPKKGSQLIMGLNPPFGVKAALANKFIDKALEFEPKLLILIVPPETEGLDMKETPYDLIWKEDNFLSGKSFYLPGSVDENNKQIDQWNVTAPPLYLWSHQEWSAKHKAIAQKHGHPFRKRPEESNRGAIDEGYKGGPPCNNSDRESQDSHGHPGKSHCDEVSRKKNQGEKEVERGTGGKAFGGRQDDGKRSSVRDSYKGVHCHSPSTVNGRSSMEDSCRSAGLPSHADVGQDDGKKPSVSDSYKGVHCHSPSTVKGRSSMEGSGRSARLPSHADVGDYEHRDTGSSVSYMEQHGRASGGSRSSFHDDRSRMQNTNKNESYSEILGLSNNGSMLEQSIGLMSDGTQGIDYRSYARERERELDMQSHGHFYGQGGDYAQGQYVRGPDMRYAHVEPPPSIPYGHLGSAAGRPYMMDMPAIQRYAPRLDELNHTMAGSLGPEPSLLDRNGVYDPRAMGAGYHGDTMGFAPGPHYPYAHHSGSWPNE